MNKMKLLLTLLFLSATLLATSIRYSYDAAGRLTKVDYGDGRSISYTYDAVSNILKRERAGAPSAAALSFDANQGQIDPRNQFLARRGNYSVAVSAQEAHFTLPGTSVRLE